MNETATATPALQLRQVRKLGNRTLKLVVENIDQVFQLASVAQHAAGQTWYQVAHDEAQRLADAHELPIDIAVGVIAALSPQCAWGENVSRAAELCATGRCRSTTRVFEGNARQILDGLVWARFGVAKDGPKVWSFFDNILDPSHSDEVTIDRHALSIACGRVVGKLEGKRLLGAVGSYELLSTAYRIVAERYGLAPHQVQATTWVVWTELATKAQQRAQILEALCA